MLGRSALEGLQRRHASKGPPCRLWAWAMRSMTVPVP